jgi:hypothetical protein
MSPSFMPALLRARRVAGIGSSSMITGSPAVTVMWWMRASGFSPCSFKARSFTTSAADAPSQIWLALAAEMTPSSCSSFTEAIPSRVASSRMPSSRTCWVGPSGPSTVSGTISAANAPASVALVAAWWLRSAYRSSSSRLKPYLSAIICAPVNWLKLFTPKRSWMRALNGPVPMPSLRCSA